MTFSAIHVIVAWVFIFGSLGATLWLGATALDYCAGMARARRDIQRHGLGNFLGVDPAGMTASAFFVEIADRKTRPVIAWLETLRDYAPAFGIVMTASGIAISAGTATGNDLITLISNCIKTTAAGALATGIAGIMLTIIDRQRDKLFETVLDQERRLRRG